jgi:Tat protein secretion system quality control protein TatD with DNase activity
VFNVVVGLEWVLGLVIKKCQWACDYLHTYQLKVEEHEDDVVAPTLFKWMCDEREEFTEELLYAAAAADECVVEIGLRPRCATSVECVGRMIRRKLSAIKLLREEDEDEGPRLTPYEVVYLGEIGTQFYFNPPYHVKAATGKLSGFQ